MSISERSPIIESPEEQPAEIKRIVASSVIGTAVEWYDFLIYGATSALVFNKLFFPLANPALGTIAAFGTYGVGFLARPMGAAIFGHFGDRVGRKAMLAMTIVIMGLGTFLIGLLPTYDQIGIFAPILLVLLRLLQGIGLGGEWGGAVLMVVENAPARSRGLLGSMVQMGYPIGNLAAFGALALFSGCTSGISWPGAGEFRIVRLSPPLRHRRFRLTLSQTLCHKTFVTNSSNRPGNFARFIAEHIRRGKHSRSCEQAVGAGVKPAR